MSSISAWQWIALAWLAGGKLLTIWLVSALSMRRPFSSRQVYAVATKEGQTKMELAAAWMLLTDPLALGLLLAFGAFDLAPDSAANIAATFGALFLWSDVWGYWSHRAMHEWRWAWRIHAHHHRSRSTRPTSSISFSFVEKAVCYTLAWLLPMAAWSHIAPVSFAGLVAFYTFYFFSSPIAHGNFELASHRLTWPMKALGTATSHAMHHARVTGNYGFLTTISDRLFGTFWADSDELHDRVITGSPLASLKEGHRA